MILIDRGANHIPVFEGVGIFLAARSQAKP